MYSCSLCRKNKILYSTHTNKNDCPFLCAQYCLYCYEKGHSISVCKQKANFSPVKLDIYRAQNVQYKPSIDIRDDERSIIAFLSSQGIQRKKAKDLDIFAKSKGVEIIKIKTIK